MDMSKFTDPYMIESLRNEIRVMQKLTGDHVVRMYDVQGNAKETFIILEFCPEGDLRKFMEKHGGQLTEKQSVDVLKQLMEGFKCLVSQGYIHRDIKPENSLVKDGKHKVADFGFATKADISGVQRIRECVGTPLYMAP